MLLPSVSPVKEIHARLQSIFPEGSPNRNNCTWEIAARTIFVMLYIGAIEGTDIWIRPDQVTRMTDDQSEQLSEAERLAWTKESVKSSKGEIPGRWYAVNTRESIRDDTIRAGLIANGVVIEREGLATTSPAPRYALASEFTKLLDPALSGKKLTKAIADWQADHLNAGALARIAIVRRGAIAGGDHVLVKFPSGETRRMAPGPSSIISKAVIEVFAPSFLQTPGVVFLSESRNKVVSRDDELAKAIGLNIKAEKNLPDIVLADLGPKHPILIFIEVVATDGPVTKERRQALLQLAKEAGFPPEHVAFATAFLDRSDSAFKKVFDSLAWGTFVWLASEPDNLIYLHEGQTQLVRALAEWK
ncbi:BsuBI/PstI family type II restriction endonuclease [Acidiphilium cryptum]|uniref:BsuBIPstI restriction endonuclease domain protein n=1 Tax=Acidiphilium cryptum (strain JF-5) TaxID=349163 RepID=A5FWN0_ACICJ|nr:BsuBI/PstI family type II restriction endonuclease [Acidiphilium cryptum]ABQ30012.1 BsuBIPstI restriction endonuclease domain protein [Acidiphilium cryptum JF-5]